MGYVYQLVLQSDKMLKATLDSNTKQMEEISEYAHDTEIPILKYNDENSLSCVITLIYLNARDCYRIEREEKNGKGFVDFIFYPNDKYETSIILELKCNKSAKEAIKQIKTKKYYSKLKYYKGNILAVGMNYSTSGKNHQCLVEDITELVNSEELK